MRIQFEKNDTLNCRTIGICLFLYFHDLYSFYSILFFLFWHVLRIEYYGRVTLQNMKKRRWVGFAHIGMYEYAINTIVPIHDKLLGHENEVLNVDQKQIDLAPYETKDKSDISPRSNLKEHQIFAPHILPSSVHGLCQCQTLAKWTQTSLTRRRWSPTGLLSGTSFLRLRRRVLSVSV